MRKRKRMETFGDLVYKHRKQRGLTLEALAELIHVSPATISRVENRTRKKLGYILVLRIRKALDIEEPEDGFTF